MAYKPYYKKHWTVECIDGTFQSPIFLTKQACLAWIAQQQDPTRLFPKKWVM